MIRRARSVWIWAASGGLLLLWTPLLGAIWLCDRDPRRLRTARWFRRLGHWMARVNPWRIRITGLENLKAGQVYVIVSNHQSMADIPLISHLNVDAKWLVKIELYREPFIGWMLRMAGDIPVDRADRIKSARALLQCGRRLRERCSIMCFPEGTRSPDGQVLPFNEGPFQLAIREKVPILPLVVEGSGAALPRNSWIFTGTKDVLLHVLPAVPSAGRDVKRSGELRDEVRGMIMDELARMRRGAAATQA